MAAGAQSMYSGATEPIWFGDRKVWTVTGFVSGVRARVMDSPALWVQGEVSEFKAPPHLRTAFFTLKDPENGFTVSCTMPRSRVEALGLTVSDGDLVQAFGSPEIYAPRGSFQMRVQSIELAGRGLLMQQLEALKARLQDEGLFDESRKRPVPFMPRRVGVVTGSGAAAQGDFLRNVAERFPPVQIAMVETLVQGDRAAAQVVAAIRQLDAVDDVDVIVVTRGGGAFEDFLPFSDERVCRAIAEARTPIVSAIGHEKDSPICDLVADLRVSTPTAAARTVVPDHADLVRRLDGAQRQLRRRGADAHERRATALATLRTRLDDRSPARVIADRQRWIEALGERSHTAVRGRLGTAATSLERDGRDLRRALRVRLDEHAARLAATTGRLRALSPRAVMGRGYAIVRGEGGAILRQADAAAPGQTVKVQLAQGSLRASVTEVHDG